ncbi:MAG: fatty acid desaturase [Gammaproteobacteria bacterium]|nr:fatty acid desaturase [Gammaproteobacteria bacterium]
MAFDIPLTENELEELTSRSDILGWWTLFCQLAITAASFALAAVWPNPLTFIVGTILLGGRQMGFFVLTHEAGHNTLFKSKWLNECVCAWLTAPMDFFNGKAYMREHLEHHRSVGNDNDPDLANYYDYPISKERLKRKLKRDLTGQTGVRDLAKRLKGFFNPNLLGRETQYALIRGLVWHLVLFLILSICGVPHLIFMWFGALVFCYPAIARLRQVSEHGAVPDLSHDNPRFNTRTTIISPLVRLLLCPHGVNYHVEHHLNPAIPIYRLPAVHRLLKERGYFNGIHIPTGYLQVIKQLTHAS